MTQAAPRTNVANSTSVSDAAIPPALKNIFAKINSASATAQTASSSGLTEAQIKTMFMERLAPSLAALTSQAESLGKTLTDQVQGDLLAQHEAELAKTRKSLEGGVLDTLVANVTGILVTAADVLKGAGEQVAALYAKDKPGVLNFVTEVLHMVKESFNQVMGGNAMLKAALMRMAMNNTARASSTLPTAEKTDVGAIPVMGA